METKMKSFFQKKASLQNTVHTSARPGTILPLNTAETASPTRSTDDHSPQKKSIASRMLDGVITVSLAALFFGIPIFFTGFSLQGVVFEKELYFYIWLLLAAVAWVSQGVIAGEMRIRKTPLDIPILVFLLTFGASIVFSVDRWHSFWGSFGDPSRGFLNLAAGVAAYYLILSHMNGRRLKFMLASSVTAFFLVAIWTLLAAFEIRFLPDALAGRAPISLMGSLSALTIFSGAMLPILISVAATLRASSSLAKIWKFLGVSIAGVGILLDLALLFLLFPYVSWIAVIAGLAFFLLYVLAQVVKMEARSAWIPMVVFVILLAFSMIGNPGIIKANLPVEATPSINLSWEVAKASLKDRTFFGSGPATYGYSFSLHRPQTYNLQPFSSLRFNQGTGLFFESVSTLGLVGAGVFVLLALSFFSIGLFLLAQKKEEEKLLSLGLWSSIIVLLIAGFLTQFNGAILIVGILIGSLALSVLLRESRAEESFRHLSLQSSPKFALALAFVFLMVSAGVAFTFAFIGKVFWADTLALQAMRSDISGDDGLVKMSKASEYVPRENRYVGYLGQIYLAKATKELSKPASEQDIDRAKQYVESANALAQLAHNMSPNDIVSQETMAQILENTVALAGMKKDLLESVQRAYEQASSLEPHNPIYYLKLGQIKKTLASAASGEDQESLLSEARSLFQKSIDEKRDFTAGYLYLGLTQESSDDVDAAIVSIAKGIAVNRRSPDIDDLKFHLARLLRVRGKEEDLKLSEILLKEILTNNEKSLNAQLTLGLVYEQTDRKNEAIEAYQKILSFLDGERTADVRKQVQSFIDNVKAGKSNAQKASSIEASGAVTREKTVDSEAAPKTPVLQNPVVAPEQQSVSNIPSVPDAGSANESISNP